MEAVILRSRVGRLERLGYLVFAVVLAYALFRAAMRSRLLDLIVLCISGVLLGLGWHSGRNRSQVRIDGSGLTVEAFYAATLSIPWSEIEAFGVASLGNISEGVKPSTGKQFVGIRLASSSILKDTKLCTDNRLLADYDILLSASYGMPLKEFETYLIDAKKRAEHP
jgi:hypothetical protein